jgi:16S rRNA (adenine1518-N6/adenine1519-N6)-dimethyltransferase
LTSKNFNFKKGLGQNFIFDEEFLAVCVSNMELNANDVVVEVGAGQGTLTRVLSSEVKKIVSFEIDQDLVSFLEKMPLNVVVEMRDALKVSEEEILKLTGGRYKVVANIPYYITTPLILKFLNDTNCDEIIVLIEEEVARRIIADVGDKNYGALSVTVQAMADAKIIDLVGRDMFFPKPNVDSAFVRIVKNKKIANRPLFDKLVKGLFAFRRKTIENGLMKTFSWTREEADKVLSAANLDKMLRPEHLMPEQYIKLTEVSASFRL